MEMDYELNEQGRAKLAAFLYSNFRDYAALVALRKEEECVEIVFVGAAEEMEFSMCRGATTCTFQISPEQSVSGKAEECLFTTEDFDAEEIPDFD